MLFRVVTAALLTLACQAQEKDVEARKPGSGDAARMEQVVQSLPPAISKTTINGKFSAGSRHETLSPVAQHRFCSAGLRSGRADGPAIPAWGWPGLTVTCDGL